MGRLACPRQALRLYRPYIEITNNLGAPHCRSVLPSLLPPIAAVYNPLVFPFLYKLLRATCLHCFHFRTAGPEVDHYRRRARALMLGEGERCAEMRWGGVG